MEGEEGTLSTVTDYHPFPGFPGQGQDGGFPTGNAPPHLERAAFFSVKVKFLSTLNILKTSLVVLLLMWRAAFGPFLLLPKCDSAPEAG